MNKQTLDASLSQLYYELYKAQMTRDWEKADKIQKRLSELEKEEKRFDVA